MNFKKKERSGNEKEKQLFKSWHYPNSQIIHEANKDVLKTQCWG